MDKTAIQTIADTLVWTIVDERSVGEEIANRIGVALEKAGFTIVPTAEITELRSIVPDRHAAASIRLWQADGCP
jgi:uncharacterized metal-binding protein